MDNVSFYNDRHRSIFNPQLWAVNTSFGQTQIEVFALTSDDVKALKRDYGVVLDHLSDFTIRKGLFDGSQADSRYGEFETDTLAEIQREADKFDQKYRNIRHVTVTDAEYYIGEEERFADWYAQWIPKMAQCGLRFAGTQEGLVEVQNAWGDWSEEITMKFQAMPSSLKSA